VLAIDTPGFDEAKRSDSEILTEIAKLLSAQYELGVELKGIIYIHRITDIRYTGAAMKTFEIFKKICGEKPLKNVLLVTSRWTDDIDEELGSQREAELKDSFWAYMLAKGSSMSRFYGDHDSAVMLISQLLVKDSVVLELQEELRDGKKLSETAAGSYVHDGLQDLKAECEKELASLKTLRAELLEQDRAAKRQIQKNMAEGKDRLEKTHEQQVSLERRIGDEVHEEIKQNRGVRIFSQVLPLVPKALDILGMFVGIPPGVFSALGAAVGLAVNSWFLSVN
jgi:hypothetical protein